MVLRFLGAAQSVTGSCFLLETGGVRLVVDCGMRQGRDAKNEPGEGAFLFEPRDLDFVLLTHAHIDHSGLIPLLVKHGFGGKIICSKPTQALCGIMLPDSGHIQETEAQWKTRKRQRAGQPGVEPLYTAGDALESIQYFQGVEYNERVELGGGVAANFVDAGHMLGGSMIELYAEGKKIVFSGDIGNHDMPLVDDPSVIKSADYVVMESTYGDREHPDRNNDKHNLEDVIERTFARGGNVIMPAFSVGRTQELLFDISELMERTGRHIPVYVDSPLSTEATNIFSRADMLSYLNDKAQQRILSGGKPFSFPGLHFTKSADESRELNFMPGSKVIISSSGMCEAGRIKHHLKHNLWGKENTIVFTGFQAEGTLGRRIMDGADTVKIFGEEIHIEAEIVRMLGYSGHAGQSGLLDWATAFRRKPEKIFLVHGEMQAIDALSKLMRAEGLSPVAPVLGDAFEFGVRELHHAAPHANATAQLHSILAAQAQQMQEMAARGSSVLRASQPNERTADYARLVEQMQELAGKLLKLQ